MEDEMAHFNGDTEDYRNQKLDFKILKGLLPRFRPHMKSLIFCGLLLAASSLISLSGPLLVKHAIDVNFPEKDFPGLLITAGLFLGVIIFTFFITYFQQIKLEIVGQKIVKSIRIEIFRHLTRLSQAFFDKNPVGKILSRVESDTEALRTMFTYTVVTMISDLLMMFGMFFIMFMLSPRLTLVLTGVVPLVIFMIRWFNRRIVPIFIEVRRRTAEVYGFLEEYLRGVRIVQAFDREATVNARMDQVNREKFEVEYPGERLSNYFGHSIFLMSTIATVLILGIGGKWVLESPETLTIGTLAAFLGYIDRFFGPIFHLSDQINVIQRAFAGSKRIDDIMSIPAEDGVMTSLPDVQDGEMGITPAIEFRNVWFAYADEEWVLRDVSFSIPAGSRFAIVGPTGSGKTTIISLLFRFYHQQKGEIFVDGRDIRSLSLIELRGKLGLVLQDIVLFPGSILDNLRLENEDISEEQVRITLETMAADDLVQGAKEGLAGTVAEHGSNLSMGERQILSFARAMVHNPAIMVLDEATSSVDPLTEKRVQTAMSTMMKDRTSLIIAHRLQTILDCDTILVLQKGAVREMGTHAELMHRKDLYWNLHQIQFGNGKVA